MSTIEVKAYVGYPLRQTYSEHHNFSYFVIFVHIWHVYIKLHDKQYLILAAYGNDTSLCITETHPFPHKDPRRAIVEFLMTHYIYSLNLQRKSLFVKVCRTALCLYNGEVLIVRWSPTQK